MDDFKRMLDNLGPVTKSWMAVITVSFFLGIFINLKGLLPFSSALVLNGDLWRLASYPFVHFSALEFLFGLLMLFFFADYERKWGSKDFLNFAIVSQLGAAILAVLIYSVLPYSINDAPVAGVIIFIDALLMHMVLTNPDSQILFGFVLPIKTKFIVIGFFVLQFLQALNGEPNYIYIFIGSIIMGYLLTTGKWRPDQWRKKPKLKIVPKTYH